MNVKREPSLSIRQMGRDFGFSYRSMSVVQGIRQMVLSAQAHLLSIHNSSPLDKAMVQADVRIMPHTLLYC